MANQFVILRSLLVTDYPLLVGSVISHEFDGSSRVQLPGGGIIQVRGQSVAVGSNAFVRYGEIRSEAPDLDSITITV